MTTVPIPTPRPRPRPSNPASGKNAGTDANSAKEPCPGRCPRCVADVTEAQLKQIFATAPQDKLTKMKNAFNEAFEKFDMDRCLRKAHFFAQVRQEVGDSIKARTENMNYTPKSLKKTFKYFRRHPSEADQYGRTKAHKADQEAIANRAYANRIGNGNVASGDGWQFRGKGYIQLTGRENYERAQKEIDKKYPGSGVDIIKRPDDILTVKGGMISAMAYWSMNGLNQKSDEGTTEKVVDSITAVVNKHTTSYDKRVAHFKKAAKAFEVDKCNNRGKNVNQCLGP